MQTDRSNKWRWNESIHESFYVIGVELTNAHVRVNPLRAEDNEKYARKQNCLTTTALEQI